MATVCPVLGWCCGQDGDVQLRDFDKASEAMSRRVVVGALDPLFWVTVSTRLVGVIAPEDGRPRGRRALLGKRPDLEVELAFQLEHPYEPACAWPSVCVRSTACGGPGPTAGPLRPAFDDWGGSTSWRRRGCARPGSRAELPASAVRALVPGTFTLSTGSVAAATPIGTQPQRRGSARELTWRKELRQVPARAWRTTWTISRASEPSTPRCSRASAWTPSRSCAIATLPA